MGYTARIDSTPVAYKPTEAVVAAQMNRDDVVRTPCQVVCVKEQGQDLESIL
ncbi:MAG: hypothetical protein AAFX99_21425 [Myxococcota bacterium]